MELGQVSGKNLALDNNEIMAWENGKPADLTLQAEGGNLIIQSFKSDRDSHVGIGNPVLLNRGMISALKGCFGYPICLV